MITDIRQEVVYQQTAVNKHDTFVTSNIKSYTDGYANNSSLSILYTQSTLAAVDQLSAFSHNPAHSFRSCSNSVSPFISYNDARGYWSPELIIVSVGAVDGYALEARVWFDNVSNNTRTIFSTHQDDGVSDQLGWALCVEGATHVVSVYVGAFGAGTKTSSGKRLAPYRWYTITGYVDRVTDTLTVYVDGMKFHEFAGTLAGLDYDWHYPVFGDYKAAAGTQTYTLRGIEHHCRVWDINAWTTNYTASSIKAHYRGPVLTAVPQASVQEFPFIPINASSTAYNLYPLIASSKISDYSVSANFLQPIDSDNYLRTMACDPSFVCPQYLTQTSVQFNSYYDTRAETIYSGTVSTIMMSHRPDPDHTYIRWPIHPDSTAYFEIKSQGPLLFAVLPGNEPKPYTPGSCCGTIDPVTGIMAINNAFAHSFQKYAATAGAQTKWNIETVVSNYYTQVWLDFIIPANYTSSNHGTIYHTDILESQAPGVAHCAQWSSKMLLPTPQVVKVAVERY